jgi:flagellar biogenesis protein FliO
MRALLAWLTRKLGMPRTRLLRVAAAQPLGAGLMVYAIDVDSRRIVLAVSPGAMCVLDRYRTPQAANPAGPTAVYVQTRHEMIARNDMGDA